MSTPANRSSSTQPPIPPVPTKTAPAPKEPPAPCAVDRPSTIRYLEGGRLGPLWTDYRGFRYADVIIAALELDGNTSLAAQERAACYALAGASAYLLGRRADAESFLRRSIEAYPHAQLDPSVFPGDLCRLYDQLRQSN